MTRKRWHQAAIDGATDEMRSMLDDGQLVDALDHHGQTALLLAARQGHEDVVKLLLQHHAHLDVTAKYGLSALMLSVLNGHEAIATMLVEAGVDTTLEGTGAPGFAGRNAAALAREANLDALADRIIIDLIARAFGDMTPPSEMSDSLQLSDAEYEEVMAFSGLRWQDIDFDLIERNADAVFWFAPEAFHYYLPGFLCAGLRAQRSDTNAYDSLVGMLDRSTEPDYWDDFFVPRWTRLTSSQLKATAAWVDWLQAKEPDAFHANSYDRVRDTLAILGERSASGETS